MSALDDDEYAAYGAAPEYSTGAQTGGVLDVAFRATSIAKKVDTSQLRVYVEKKTGAIKGTVPGEKTPARLATYRFIYSPAPTADTSYVGIGIQPDKIEQTNPTMQALTRSVLSDWTLIRDKIIPLAEKLALDHVKPEDKRKFVRVTIYTPKGRLGSAYAPEFVKAIKANGYQEVSWTKESDSKATKFGERVVGTFGGDAKYEKTLQWQ